MYAIKSYVKTEGSVGYELFNEETGEVLLKDDSYSVINDVKRRMEEMVAEAKQ